MLGPRRRFIFTVVLLSYLCRGSTALKPNISLTTDQIFIKEGEPLLLNCSGNSDIFFTYPTNLSYHSSTLEYYTSPVEINKIQDECGSYWYDFRRPNTVFGDTGWYGCSYHPILTTRHNYSDPEISLVYVYVESKTVRFVEQATIHKLVTTICKNIVIPCRPTSPTAKVMLTKFDGDGDIVQYTFDPKIGFTLKKVCQDEFYVCTIGPDQKVSYDVIVTKLADNILLQPTIVNNTLRHEIQGNTLFLECAIYLAQYKDYNHPVWRPKHLSGRVTTWNETRNMNDDTIGKMALLRVTNVTYEDEGIYECRAEEWVYEKHSQTYVQVHERPPPFMKITSWDPNRYYTRHEGDPLQWVVDVDAYPPPDVQWLNTYGNEMTSLLIPQKSKYPFVVTLYKSILEIDSLDLNDMGTYSIQASNSYKKETLNFVLDVIARPKLYMSKPNTYYFPNQVTKLECHVEAFPKPNITWSYRKCPNYPSCDDGTLEYLTNSKEEGTVIQLVSTIWTVIEMSGELTCEACNSAGCDTVTNNVSVSDEVGEFGIILTKDPVIEGDEWGLICAASMRNYSDNFDWHSEDGPIVQSDRYSIDRGKTQFTYKTILKIHNVKIEDSQEYICRVKFAGNLTRSTGYRLEVQAAQAPIITDTNLKNGETIIDLNTRGRKAVDFYCFADGKPKPSISWFKDGRRLLISNEKHMFSNNSQKVEIEYPLEIDSGKYMCRAENRIGKVEVFQQIMIKGFRIPVGVIILLVMLAVTVLILVIYVALKVHSDRMKKRKLLEAAFLHFEEGAVESLNPDLTVDDQAYLLPYDNKWEFPKERLRLGKHLGSGAFGVVLKAEGLGICEGEAITTVAVKMVRRAPNLVYICALASELKIMVHLGKHLNVVNLLGACTKNILKHELLVIVEFCRFGNLHSYLLRHRSGFINQIDPVSGKLDLSIGLLTKIGGVCVTNSNNRNSESDSVQCHAQATDSQGVDMSAGDSVLNSASTQPGWSNCRGDYKDSNLKPICTQDLLSWAFQVARGMEYISQRKILHGDLAARNVLLADNNVVKICDFGLAKNMYKEEIYKKKSDCPLPIKWLAIETMRDQIFSTQSDIWSFGIVLWEFFTLAETPYPGMETEIVYQKLIEGYRMEQPEYATPEVYDIMCQCWKAEPSLRPSFTDLVNSVGKLLEDNVRTHYIELNAPYLDVNRALLVGGKQDYLAMFSAPDHAVLSTSTHDCANSTASGTAADSGYVSVSLKDAVDTSPMLKKEEEEPYLEPINVHTRRAELARNRGVVKYQLVH
ncbi:vascular endothelial growth factor receptor 1 [Megalopta genalis]|uniref:vascular endothelial growth factor receptor 1 n=1 Tax=Megalopta genalis TaxID=115081 RepID=UPI003FCEF39D